MPRPPGHCAEKRRKQFALLFDCIDDLQRALRAETEEDESRKESVATGKRKRPSAAEADDALKGKALADDPPAVSSSAAETARKRVREVEMEEARDDETEPGEITTKGNPSPSSSSQLSLVVDESWAGGCVVVSPYQR